MCEYLRIKTSTVEFIHRLQEKLHVANESYELERKSIVSIQRLYRGYQVRSWIQYQTVFAIEIQRIYRGYRGKMKAQREQIIKLQNRHDALINYFVLQIQRISRGFVSRRNKFDFYKRKSYINGVKEKGDFEREVTKLHIKQQMENIALEDDMKKDGKMKTFASNLHHLLSTQQIRGVYNPNPQYIPNPTLKDIPVEQHIRQSVRDLLRAKGITKRGLVTDINGTLRVPLPRRQNQLSIQASTPYYEKDRLLAREKAYLRILSRMKGNFFAGGKTNIINKDTEPMTKGDSYVDKWANPMTIRGVPENQKQLLESCRLRKPLFVKNHLQPIPFVSRTGGNKSTVHANDLFDTIADADVTGGAIHRHLGSSQRFGVPDNADNRPFGGDVPYPSLKRSPTIM